MSDAPADRYEAAAWLVTLPGGYESLHFEQPKAIQYAARNHGVVVPLYRKIPAQAGQGVKPC